MSKSLTRVKAALAAHGWQPVSLGRSILRAVTAPVALLGAVQFQLPGLSTRGLR